MATGSQDTPRKPAVVLLSGGLDSATVLAVAQSEDYAIYALSFAYGQRQRVELQAAKTIAQNANVQEHRIIDIDLRAFGKSALTDDIDVPKDRSESAMGDGIPVTYVPARNTIFLSYALAWAEVLGASDLFIGVNAVDYSGYPDCRPEFISAFEALANKATAAATEHNQALRVHAPLIDLSKADIIKLGTSLGVDYGMTHSCYDPVNTLACGRCDSCQLRKAGFAQAGVPDPTQYVTTHSSAG